MVGIRSAEKKSMTSLKLIAHIFISTKRAFYSFGHAGRIYIARFGACNRFFVKSGFSIGQKPVMGQIEELNVFGETGNGLAELGFGRKVFKDFKLRPIFQCS